MTIGHPYNKEKHMQAVSIVCLVVSNVVMHSVIVLLPIDDPKRLNIGSRHRKSDLRQNIEYK